MITVIKSLNHTSKPSFSVISLPKIAVKPAKKTATCSCIRAFFMMRPPLNFVRSFAGTSKGGGNPEDRSEDYF